ncbi:MAG: metal-dependent transcriptional regulator [Acholeplasmatales bacterium]|nr:metal-dependent transcriptional regulator [Acholeplasmatales bacterium]
MAGSNESEEMYLKTILILSGKLESVRLVDVAASLGYAKSSVSNALKELCKKDLIIYGNDKRIVLTDAGKAEAEKVNERYEDIMSFLMQIGADKNVAEIDACRLEHIVSDELYEVIKRNLKK